MSSPSVAEPAGQSGIQSRLHALTIPQTLKRWLREPLVHFLLIGAALFAVYAYLHRGRMGIESSHQIVVSLDELRQMDLYFVSQWHRQPTVKQFNAMVEDKVREEVLYREALAIGLDNDDTIVKRPHGAKNAVPRRGCGRGA